MGFTYTCDGDLLHANSKTLHPRIPVGGGGESKAAKSGRDWIGDVDRSWHRIWLESTLPYDLID